MTRDPTARGDDAAAQMREWYEANRESWWDRHGFHSDRSGWHADNFMLRLMAEAERIIETVRR